jgi:hypothetical protein
LCCTLRPARSSPNMAVWCQEPSGGMVVFLCGLMLAAAIGLNLFLDGSSAEHERHHRQGTVFTDAALSVSASSLRVSTKPASTCQAAALC